MKDKIIKILLIILIAAHAISPFVELYIVGYDISEMLSDIYHNSIIVILSAAVLRLYNSKNHND